MTKKRGLGVGSMFYGIGYGFNRADIGSAYIEMAEDGTTTVYSGACDMGQGIMTVVAQVAAEVVGADIDTIRVVAADTTSTPDAGPTSGSRATFVQGIAVHEAASDLHDQLMQTAAGMFECEKDELEAHNGDVYLKGANAPIASLAEVAARVHLLGGRCGSWGWHDNSTADVDTETGHVKVLKIVSATDAGKAINPVAVEGQIQGGAAMGVGYALYEQHILDQGVPRTDSMAFYLVPTSMDVPEIQCEIVEVYDPKGPFGAKGIAEPATVPTTPAILNAIYDAIGIRITDTPATPERVFQAIQEARARGEFED